MKDAVPDYKTIVKQSGGYWNDPVFPADQTSLAWSSYTNNNLDGYYNNRWSRLTDLCPTCSIFGSDNFLNDIAQGSLGDCYYLAGMSSAAEIDSRFQKAFVNPQVNYAGLYAFNVYIRGIPHQIVVDDAVPAGNYGKSPVFAGFGSDGSIWGPLLEKAWAKANGNYEKIISGNSYEAWDFVTSAPHDHIYLTTLSTDAMWTKVSAADNANNIMALGTYQGGGDTTACAFNLPCGHAYSLISVATVFNSDRTEKIQLYKVRNPWRVDNAFGGSFADGAAVWTTVGADGKTYA